MLPVGCTGALPIGLSAEPASSPPEPASVSEPDGEPVLPPPTWTNPEVSSGLAGTAAGNTASAGSSDAGSGATRMGQTQTGAASPLTVSSQCRAAAHWLFLQPPRCDWPKADGDSARHHLWIQAKRGRESFNGGSMGV